MDKANPNAAVTPISGAPLTHIFFIAKKKSLIVFNFFILNLNGKSV